MAKTRKFSEFPRPWYISLTALWQDDRKRYPQFESLVTRPNSPCQPAGNHVFIPQSSWHFTVLAIVRINDHPDEFQSMREFAQWVLDPLRINPKLIQALRASFKPFTAIVDEVRCFDNGTVLQFECGERLKTFRKQARTLLQTPVSLLVRAHANSAAGRRFKKKWGIPILQSMLADSKNDSSRAFGSIARSPCRDDGSRLRWRKPLKHSDQKKFAFQHVHLLVSNDVLTNPRDAEEDFLI